MTRLVLSTTVGLIALCAASAAPHAGPVGTTAQLARVAGEAGMTQTAAARRCWTWRGLRPCRRHVARSYGGIAFQRDVSRPSIGLLMGVQ